jgi:hypothetical protein
MVTAKSPPAPSRPVWISSTAGPQSAFTWEGSDEMDEVPGDGSAELLDGGTLESNSPITTATKPSSRPNATLLQQPALMFGSRCSGSIIISAAADCAGVGCQTAAPRTEPRTRARPASPRITSERVGLPVSHATAASLPIVRSADERNV